jgi:hypothetical protein
MIQRETDLVTRKRETWFATKQAAGATWNGTVNTPDLPGCSEAVRSTAIPTVTVCRSWSGNDSTRATRLG